MTDTPTVDAEVWPEGSLEVLSQVELDMLTDGAQFADWRQCGHLLPPLLAAPGHSSTNVP